MSSGEEPTVLISIVHYAAPALLSRCLASFEAHPPAAPHRIVVADNSARIQPIREVVSRFKGVTLLEMPDNIGFSAANNRAVRGAREKYLFFLNPDTEVTPGAIDSLVALLEANPEVGAVGPKNVGAEGEVQFSCRTFPGYRTLLGHRYSLLTRLFPTNPYSTEYLHTNWDHEARREVDWISGAAILMRRGDFEELGGFDEAFFMYAEDVDLCYRLHQAGKKVVYEPSAVIRHEVGGSTGRNRFRALWERHRSMYTFFKKHYSLEIPLIDLTTLLGITLRGIYFLLLEALGRAPHRAGNR
ncbi:MAG: glycosyltransferase family 2 protein [Candidatus Omnitrophica bacterium]|nr:N-acetylglucosaminyl-diphospho-decaprenol L-rhamnosyltransferase [bacterium]NUN95874.1 glycosyltransferase family 2 protein [Candidatus Omnitrophota bacterium]